MLFDHLAEPLLIQPETTLDAEVSDDVDGQAVRGPQPECLVDWELDQRRIRQAFLVAPGISASRPFHRCWLPEQDSNLHGTGSRPVALPLGHPATCFRIVASSERLCLTIAVGTQQPEVLSPVVVEHAIDMIKN